MKLLLAFGLSLLIMLGQSNDALERRTVNTKNQTRLVVEVPKPWIPFRSSLPGVFFSVVAPDNKYAFMVSEFLRSDSEVIEDAAAWTKSAAEMLNPNQVSHEEVAYTPPAGYVAHEHITVQKLAARNERVATRLRILTSRDGTWLIKYSITCVYPEGAPLPGDFREFSRRIMSTVTFSRGRPI